MTYYIDVQNASTDCLPINEQELIDLASRALRDYQQDAEVTIRLVNPEEMTYLNNRYRKHNKPTNVLSFPSTVPPEVQLECPFLGDVIVCPQVLSAESNQLHKSLESHWALIIIHGILHLLGYDHLKEDEASLMQSIEIKLLAELGYTNPYKTEGDKLE